jgi:hypothetical protein
MKPRAGTAERKTGDGAVRDPEIRIALLKEFRRRRLLRGTTVVVQELGLRRSDAVVDVAVVNGSLNGFEIKSDADTLRRLERQAEIYGQILDRVTLVVGQQHLGAARRVIPDWWGLMAVQVLDDGPTLTTVRQGRENPARHARALVELLWLDEARALLAKRDALRGYRTKPRDAVWDKLCEVYSLDEIASAVRQRLKARAASGLLRRLS